MRYQPERALKAIGHAQTYSHLLGCEDDRAAGSADEFAPKIGLARNLVNFLAVLPGISKPNRTKPPGLRQPGSRAFRHDWRRRSALPFPCALSKWRRGCSRCQGAAEYSSSTLCDP